MSDEYFSYIVKKVFLKKTRDRVKNPVFRAGRPAARLACQSNSPDIFPNCTSTFRSFVRPTGGQESAGAGAVLGAGGWRRARARGSGAGQPHRVAVRGAGARCSSSNPERSVPRFLTPHDRPLKTHHFETASSESCGRESAGIRHRSIEIRS